MSIELYTIICNDCDTDKKEIKKNKLNIFPAKLANALNFLDPKYQCSLIYYTNIIDLMLENLQYPNMIHTIEIFKYLSLIEKHKQLFNIHDKIYREMNILRNALFDRNITSKLLYKLYEPIFYHIIKKLDIPVQDKLCIITGLSKVFYMSKCVECPNGDIFNVLKPNSSKFKNYMDNTIKILLQLFRNNNLLNKKIEKLFE